MKKIVFEFASTLTAFRLIDTVGSKVVQPVNFCNALAGAAKKHDPSKDRTEGQHFVQLPESAWSTVSAGVGHKSNNPDDYIVRMYRGQPTMFLRRKFAAPVEGLACVVYTRQAYLNDPDVLNEPQEIARIQASDCTRVIVAVLAFAGPKAPLTPYRLVHNLAGGNNEVDAWTKDDIVAKAKESLEYWNEWVVVAD